MDQPLFSVVFMKQNQNSRQNRQGRSGQHNNQKRSGKGRHNHNRQQQPNSPTRQIDSRGPAGNQRGNAKQLYEKYKILAQEKRSSNRQESESLSQYADHYYRIHSEFAAAEAASQEKREKARVEVREKEQARKAEEEAARSNNASAEVPQPSEQKSENSEPEKSVQKPEKKPRRKMTVKSEETKEQKPEVTEAQTVNP